MENFVVPDEWRVFDWPLVDFLVPPWGEHGPRPGLLPGQMVEHLGIDLDAEEGADVVACAPGVVTLVLDDADPASEGGGNQVWLSHLDGLFQTGYMHLADAPSVAVGDEVTPETVLGRVGATGNARGPHVCLETRIRGHAVNPRQMMRDYGRS